MQGEDARLFRRVERLIELRQGKLHALFLRHAEPSLHGNPQFRHCLFACGAKSRAGFQVRRVGDPSGVGGGPEGDDGVVFDHWGLSILNRSAKISRMFFS
jgi:hypothetical protein